MSDVIGKLQKEWGPEALPTSQFRDNIRLHVDSERVAELLETLRSDHGFDMLFELTAVDYLYYPDATDRYGVVYGLLNTTTGERIFVKTLLNDPDPQVPSAVPLWQSADWMEREVYDMYGIGFPGHPDLRRILMPPEFATYPLRKDYPLRGRGERHNFPVITRAES